MMENENTMKMMENENKQKMQTPMMEYLHAWWYSMQKLKGMMENENKQMIQMPIKG